MTPSRRGRDEGLGLVDLIVAATIFLLVIVAAAYVAQQSSMTLAASRERTDAATLANNVLSMMAASNCGLSTGVDVTATTPASTKAAQPGAPSATKVEMQCKALDGAKTLLGDPTPHDQVAFEGYKFTVTSVTEWVTDATSGTATTSNVCPGTTYTPPVGAYRNILIEWTPGASHTPETYPGSGVLTTFTLTPQGVLYHNTSDGGVVFKGMAGGGKIVLQVPGFATIQRIANADKCVWFPFLPPGSYKASYYSSGTSTGTAATLKFTVTTGKNHQVTVATHACSTQPSHGNGSQGRQCGSPGSPRPHCHFLFWCCGGMFTHCGPLGRGH